MDRVKAGVKGMDRMLKGGLPRGRTFLVSGSSGCGKTIFASQFIREGIKSGEPCLYVTFEQGKKRLMQDLKEIGIDFGEAEKSGKLTLVGGPVGHVKFFKDRTRANMFDISKEIREIIEESGAKRVVLDSVNLFTLLFETDSDRRKALAELTSTLDALDCTTVLTCEVPEGSKGISWYGFEEFVVDGVIVLHRIPFENMYERAVSIVKMRGIGHSESIRALKIRDDGITVYPDLEPFHKASGKKAQ